MSNRVRSASFYLEGIHYEESDHGCSVFAVHSGEHTYFGLNMDGKEFETAWHIVKANFASDGLTSST